MGQMDLPLAAERLTDLLERLELTASPAGITRVGYRRGATAAARRPVGRIGRLLEQARQELAEYLAGRRSFFSVPVDLSAVPEFERAALEIAGRIPFGEVRSYKWIAEQLGQPEAARAVGGAMAGNPVPLIVPCHRVVRSDGGLGGYTFGLVRKAALLDLERRSAPLVGSTATKLFCRLGCARARRFRERDRIQFLSAAAATQRGYRPCPVCRPA
jgi:methylated-DNA-[protein]-cysteine S-methyltransferase